MQQFLRFWKLIIYLSKHLLLKNVCYVDSDSSDLNLSEKLTVLKVHDLWRQSQFSFGNILQLFVVNWPEIIACYKFNKADVQLVFFTCANQQTSYVLYYYMDFPSGLKSFGNIRIWFSYSSFLTEEVLHKPFLFCVGIAGARWLFDRNSSVYIYISIYIFLIFKFSIILFPLPHCSSVIDLPVSSIAALEFQ